MLIEICHDSCGLYCSPASCVTNV